MRFLVALILAGVGYCACRTEMGSVSASDGKSSRMKQASLGLQAADSKAELAVKDVKRASRPAERVRAILVFDTDADNIGPDVVMDQRRIQKVLEDVFPKSDKRLVLEGVFTGAKANRDNILTCCQELKSGPQDTILFVYSGHGGVSRLGGHFLGMKHGGVYRSEVRKELEGKPHQLLVLLTDSCGSFVPSADDHLASRLAHLQALKEKTPAINRQVVECLLLGHRGVVDINAALEGTVAHSTRRGGYFLRAFADLLYEPTKSLDYNKDGFVGWDEFYVALGKRLTALNAGHQPQPYSTIPAPAVGPPSLPPVRGPLAGPRLTPEPSNPDPPKRVRGRL